MSVATGTAIAIAVGAGTAASQIYAAKKGAESNDKAVAAQTASSDKATAAQTAASDEALAFQKENLAKRQAALAPFIQQGTDAANRYARLTGGVPLTQAGAPPVPTARTPTLPPTVPVPAPGQQTRVPAFGAPPAAPGTTAPPTITPEADGLVTIKSPNSPLTKRVTPEQAAVALKLGGTQVPPPQAGA